MTFWYPRLAAALGIAASLLALPIHFYFIATVPFSEVFAPGHEFRLQPSAGFHWEKWTVIGVLALAAAFFLCVAVSRLRLRSRCHASIGELQRTLFQRL